MRAAGARSEARTASFVAWTCLFVLCNSGSAVFAACAVNTPTQLLALSGTCSVIGESYNGGDANIAVQASGSGASITWTSVGLSKILTSGDELPAVQADTGGSIEITGGAIQTSGAGAPAVLSEGGEGLQRHAQRGRLNPDRRRRVGGTGGKRLRRAADRHRLRYVGPRHRQDRRRWFDRRNQRLRAGNSSRAARWI